MNFFVQRAQICQSWIGDWGLCWAGMFVHHDLALYDGDPRFVITTIGVGKTESSHE